MAKKEDFIEKAVTRNIGDAHPKYPNYTWQNRNGKTGWYVTNKQSNGSSSGGDDGAKKTPSKPSASQIAGAKAKVGKPMNTQQLMDWAQKTSDDNLLKVANSKNGDVQMRKIAYDALEQRGFDMTQVDTSGNLGQLMKMTGKTGATKTANSDDSEDDVASAADDADVDIDGDSDGGTDGNKITEKWYLNRNDQRVKKMFNLNTKEGRIKYDQFLDKMKRKEKDYIPPSEVISMLNVKYLTFLKNEKKRFMISAGGAGIGKSYGFKGLATLLNKSPFEEGHTAGDGDYDYFEAPDVNSGKQLLNILKAHNGKIILFDDNDKVLSRADCASVMKKATAPTGKRIVGDPDDVKTNFEFTGRIIIMTNKDLSTLAESEDTKAIISRAMQVSEIHLTVPETIEVLEDRFQDMEFEELDRLDDAEKDKKEREEVFDIIKKNQKNIDPRHFTTRTFQQALNAKRDADDSNEFSQIAVFQKFLGSKQRDWKQDVTAIITKAIGTDEYTIEKVKNVDSDELIKAEEILFEKGYAEDDGVDYTVDDEEEEDMDEVTKAEQVLFGDEFEKAEFSEKKSQKIDIFNETDMDLQKAEIILFGE